MSKEWKAFEAWCRTSSVAGDMRRYSDGRYLNLVTNAAWQAWHAAWATGRNDLVNELEQAEDGASALTETVQTAIPESAILHRVKYRWFPGENGEPGDYDLYPLELASGPEYIDALIVRASPAHLTPAGGRQEALNANTEFSGRIIEIDYERSTLLVRYEGAPPEVGTNVALTSPPAQRCRAKQIGADQWVCDCATPLACDNAASPSTVPGDKGEGTDGVTAAVNPHPAGSEEAEAWDCGYYNKRIRRPGLGAHLAKVWREGWDARNAGVGGNDGR